VVECLSCWLDGENRSGRAQSIKIKIGTGRGRSTRPEWGSQTSTCSEKATEGGALRSVLARAPLARAGRCESGEDRSRDCAVSALCARVFSLARLPPSWRCRHATSAGLQGANLASSVRCATPEGLTQQLAHASKLREMTLLFTCRWVRAWRLDHQDRCHGDPPAV
jgi:hypothetical protein